MHCSGGSCNQGRSPCKTPEACGAQIGGGYWPALHLREEEDKPITTPEDAMEMPGWFLFLALAIVFAALMVWILNADWPVMVGMLSL